MHEIIYGGFYFVSSEYDKCYQCLKIGRFLFLLPHVLHYHDMLICIFLCNRRGCKSVRFTHLLVSEEMSFSYSLIFLPYVKYFIFIREIKSPFKCKDSIY